MKKKGLVSRTAEILRQNNVRKTVPPVTKTFHITDDDGKTSHFSAKTSGRGVLFSSADVSEVLDALMVVITESLRRGEEVYLRDFGTFGLKFRPARHTILPGTNEPVEVSARHVPKFTFGNSLRMAAKMYDLSLADGNAADDDDYIHEEDIDDDDDDFEFDDDISEGGEE